MALYKEAFGMEPVEYPEQVAVFEDYFVLIDEDTVPQNVKDTRLNFARKLAQEMVDASEEFGLRFTVQVVSLMKVFAIALWWSNMLVQEISLYSQTLIHQHLAFSIRLPLVLVYGDDICSSNRFNPVTVPKTVRVVVTGDAKGVLSPKDLILHIIGDPISEKSIGVLQRRIPVSFNRWRRIKSVECRWFCSHKHDGRGGL